MARSGKIDWRHTNSRRRDFIRVLAETYDVEAALEAGRLSWSEVCELRVRHPDFAARFEDVIVAGYDRIEAMLLKRSGVGGDGKGDLALAQALLKQRRSMRADASAGAAKRAGPRAARSEAIKNIMSEVGLLRAGQRRGRDGNGKEGRGKLASAAGRA
ncbi:MAG TPA: hypothetical protein VEY93_00180 [Longimicrobium sp.]|nr:hypothetical protein [Longimicrobium sp.]